MLLLSWDSRWYPLSFFLFSASYCFTRSGELTSAALIHWSWSMEYPVQLTIYWTSPSTVVLLSLMALTSYVLPASWLAAGAAWGTSCSPTAVCGFPNQTTSQERWLLSSCSGMQSSSKFRLSGSVCSALYLPRRTNLRGWWPLYGPSCTVRRVWAPDRTC